MSKATQLEEVGCTLRFPRPGPQRDFIKNPSPWTGVGAGMTYKGYPDSSIAGWRGTHVSLKRLTVGPNSEGAVELDGVTECGR